jgi:hypothetical protein
MSRKASVRGRYRPAPSFRGEPPVDHQDLPGDIGRRLEHRNSSGPSRSSIRRCARCRSAPHCARALGVVEHRRGQFGREKARPDGVGGDAVGDQASAMARVSCADPALGCAIGDAARKGAECLQRGEIDDPAPALVRIAGTSAGSGRTARTGSAPASVPAFGRHVVGRSRVLMPGACTRMSGGRTGAEISLASAASPSRSPHRRHRGGVSARLLGLPVSSARPAGPRRRPGRRPRQHRGRMPPEPELAPVTQATRPATAKRSPSVSHRRSGRNFVGEVLLQPDVGGAGMPLHAFQPRDARRRLGHGLGPRGWRAAR